MILYIIVIAIFALVGIYVAYEIKRAKRIKRASTKVDAEVYRRKSKDAYYESILNEPHGTE